MNIIFVIYTYDETNWKILHMIINSCENAALNDSNHFKNDNSYDDCLFFTCIFLIDLNKIVHAHTTALKVAITQ